MAKLNYRESPEQLVCRRRAAEGDSVDRESSDVRGPAPSSASLTLSEPIRWIQLIWTVFE
jgi:hypothetical protein